MIKLASEKNVDQLLSELKEYASEVDVDIVRKSVRVIGQVNYVVQEAIVVIKDIFRKYPHKYEGIIPTLCENLDALDEPEAKASLIWIIGEYAETIEKSHDLILTFLDTFRDESSQVQLQLVTATIKLFLKKPQTTPDTVQKIYKPDNNVATMEQHLTDETNLYNYVNKVKAFESKVLESEGVDQNQIKNDTKIAEKQGDLDSKSSQRRNELFNDILELRREINQWSEGNEELKQAIERGKQINRSLQQQLNEKSREISDLKNEKTKKDEGATKIFKNNNLNSKNLFRNKVKELVIEQKPKLENYLTEQKQSDSPNSKIRSEIQQIKLS
ncbi:12484_t:CDS:10 [Entrophospora sp. SA101]|nr:12484_t:CDS:10 [Entrophospora sp. SA101]